MNEYIQNLPNFNRQVCAWHHAFRVPYQVEPGVPCEDRIALRISLIREETREVIAEVDKLYNSDEPEKRVRANILKELCDLQYVLSGSYLEFGMGHHIKPFEFPLRIKEPINAHTLGKVQRLSDDLEDAMRTGDLIDIFYRFQELQRQLQMIVSGSDEIHHLFGRAFGAVHDNNMQKLIERADTQAVEKTIQYYQSRGIDARVVPSGWEDKVMIQQFKEDRPAKVLKPKGFCKVDLESLLSSNALL